MKNIGIGLSMLSMVLVMSCDKKEKTTETNTIEKETVIIKDTVQEKEEGTSVKVSGDGIDVDSKDVDVEIKK